MKCHNAPVLKCWNTDMLINWNAEMLKLWNAEMLKLWNARMPMYSNAEMLNWWKAETLKLRNYETIWKDETLRRWNYETMARIEWKWWWWQINGTTLLTVLTFSCYEKNAINVFGIDGFSLFCCNFRYLKFAVYQSRFALHCFSLGANFFCVTPDNHTDMYNKVQCSAVDLIEVWTRHCSKL